MTNTLAQHVNTVTTFMAFLNNRASDARSILWDIYGPKQGNDYWTQLPSHTIPLASDLLHLYYSMTDEHKEAFIEYVLSNS